MWRDQAGGGRAEKAFEIGKTGRDDLDHRRFLAADPAGHHRMTRPSRRSPLPELLADSGSRPGADASPLFKEPAVRTALPDDSACSRVGSTCLPHTPTAAHFHRPMS